MEKFFLKYFKQQVEKPSYPPTIKLSFASQKKTSVMKKSSTIKKVAFCYPPSFQKKKGGGERVPERQIH